MAHDFKKFPELRNSQMELYYWDSPHRQITEDFNARVVKVTDGDTIRVEWVDRDFDLPVRLANIAAPEIKESGGVRSRDWLAQQLLGEEVEILINPKVRVGKWGRLIGEVVIGGVNIGDMSRDLGFAGTFGEEDLFL